MGRILLKSDVYRYVSHHGRRCRKAQRTGAVRRKKLTADPYYDEEYDYSLIVSSFAKQYGIRLLQEDISVSEYYRLLTGLMDDTPLGRVVEIRSTTDKDRIRNMTVQEKKIRSDWAKFRHEHPQNRNSSNEIKISAEMFKNILKGLAR
ncbi:MAG: hypothetical protein IJU45_05925 [Clostridia bacterium]|nr:hypothetical protein [Clostridia bacterium]